MAMAFLSQENCDIAENANNAMVEIPKKLRACATTFRNSIKDEKIIGILDNSDVNRQMKDNLIKYCDSMDQVAFTLERLHQTISSLVLNSRRAIRTGYKEDSNE